MSRLLAVAGGALVGVALGCGITVAAYLPLVSLQLRVEERRRPEDKGMVVVAARALPAGAVIGEADVYAVQIPPRFLPGPVFQSFDDVVGARVVEDVLADELVRAEALGRGGSPP